MHTVLLQSGLNQFLTSMLAKYFVAALLLVAATSIPLFGQALPANQVTSTATTSYSVNTFTVAGLADATGHVADLAIVLSKGTMVFGQIQSTYNISFLIMNESQYKQSLSTGHFVQSASSYVFSAGEVMSYSLNWTAPDSTQYHFLFMNHSANTNVVTFTFWTQTPYVSSTSISLTP
jgi:uncharacterized membrane protein